MPNDKLPQKMSWAYLVNLIFYLIPLFTVKFAPWQYLAMLAALVLFLCCYFWAYRCNRNEMQRPVVGMLLVAILITPVNPGSVSMFAYAAFFIGYANPLRRYVLYLAAVISLLVVLNLVLNLHWPYFLHFGIPVVMAVSFLGWVEQQHALQRLAKQQSEDEMKQLAAMVERERIGRDLHDILGHTLSSIILKADLAEKLLARQQVAAGQQQLTELSQIARDALSQVRQSVAGYKHQGLTAEVAKLLARLRDAGFQTELQGEVPVLDQRRETAVILALTELVTNVMRHSKGNSCQLIFQQQGTDMHICLHDNGRSNGVKEGHGITGLRERLAAIGATLVLNQHSGVSAAIQLPLQES
ncbi:sensor histidine kinase [Alkalimonas amylolytica]|uniref:Two-component system, NarL family, sensor histidine kinase DesK n=1 Tax=Alkalimonas amylolytica TaxID=152573 RepID=A0A1H4DIU0_ALKAM|nr:histidine kinase [Alkalimonas amylolytica]SEA72142.1 two-component system, NarL family, sensor histidine kinase DesK [Alkalimonas amylolytica]